MIKKSSMGGPAIIFKRHVVIDGDTSSFSSAVHFSKSGKQFKHLFGIDANSKSYLLDFHTLNYNFKIQAIAMRQTMPTELVLSTHAWTMERFNGRL